jgi:hypothetical protein
MGNDEVRLYGTPKEILREFGSWSNFCLQRPEDANDIYIQLRIAALGQAFVECYAASKKAKYQDMARTISRAMSVQAPLKGFDRDRQNGICPLRESEDCDFRNLTAIVNEGDEDGLHFESFALETTDHVPFGNTQRNYPDSLEDGDPTASIIGDIVYQMKRTGEWDRNQGQGE